MARIFLIGYMGSGKTTFGKVLSKALGYEFIDMDVYIEEQQFKSISQIFEEQGEDAFRILEQKCLKELGTFENVVIATGGGAPCFFDNMEFMNTHGITAYLKLSTNEIINRLESSKKNKRPLIANLTKEELHQFITNALTTREPFYTKAHLSVSGTDEEIIAKISKKISQ